MRRMSNYFPRSFRDCKCLIELLIMIYDKLSVAFAALGICSACVAIMIVHGGELRGERAAERKERIEYRCWHEQWAETREARVLELGPRQTRVNVADFRRALLDCVPVRTSIK